MIGVGQDRCQLILAQIIDLDRHRDRAERHPRPATAKRGYRAHQKGAPVHVEPAQLGSDAIRLGLISGGLVSCSFVGSDAITLSLFGGEAVCLDLVGGGLVSCSLVGSDAIGLDLGSSESSGGRCGGSA